MRVQLFIPCFVDQLFPNTAFNMVKVLKRLGCEISYNSSQTCCGQPAFNAGYWDEAAAVAEKFVKDFSNADYVVSPSGSCTGFVRNYYHKLLPGGTKFPVPSSAIPVQKRLYEFTEFVADVLQANEVGAVMKGTGTYHDACGALRECNIRDAPRKLLAHVKGLELREADGCETCCGFGGTFAVKYEPISVAMAEQKVISAMETGAEYIISTDLSCLMHLEAYIKKHKHPIKTMHIADVLASGW
ncbi:L-lactate dehydrogenase complex protein LldE [Anseongella ginsenosidimutans]|uniref:L-lactate dehydrogenase complex protein LldE n=1 Tax=Anseongella ginsenosidimutans TaxID=496056 RepID=A0A4R3KUZ1_9SPHI|nr:(Fe-S)-binding protein [Anseongella ginsenosidimutans]QEC53062.1 (Fe-S)-binding protein [Anseongella ginsenosidimutans]TCS87677.1 L-lactate dehydrogenase complex protein LldE [Anseongella ginsenosidimutans]